MEHHRGSQIEPTAGVVHRRAVRRRPAGIAQKVGEEATETVVAALSQSDDRVIAEMADLVYHCLVLLAAKELAWTDVEAELAARFKVPAAG